MTEHRHINSRLPLFLLIIITSIFIIAINTNHGETKRSNTTDDFQIMPSMSHKKSRTVASFLEHETTKLMKKAQLPRSL